MSAVPDDIARVRDLWFDGDAWCKVAWLDALAPDAPTERPSHVRIRSAVRGWRTRRDEAAGQALIAILVDELLCAELPESSAFAELEAGPWAPCAPDEALAIAAGLQARLGCDASAAALDWFRARLDGALGVWRCTHAHATAVVILDSHLGAFFLDRG
ncbi:MAG: hypothetical protein H6737_11680 [Alphaproteobacteria bacterium]|nr:hypothetical protein [Alphaproteobacteria bacterium]